MDMKNYIKWLPALLALILEGLNVFMNLQINPKLLTILITIFFVIECFILQIEIQNFKNTHPNIIHEISLYNQLEPSFHLRGPGGVAVGVTFFL